jgi:hypothetical protein
MAAGRSSVQQGTFLASMGLVVADVSTAGLDQVKPSVKPYRVYLQYATASALMFGAAADLLALPCNACHSSQ